MRHNDPVNANNMHGGGYVIGVNFGTLSGRALVVRVADGAELGTAVHEYRHGVMDTVLASSGRPLPPDWALQDPEDYRDVLRHAVPAAIADAGIDPAQVIGIGTDFTACTVLPVLADGTPLCEFVELRDRPHAYPKLWKHHAASRRRTGSTTWRASAASRGSPATAGRSRPSGSSRRRCSCWRRTRTSTGSPAGGSRPPTGSSGS